MEPENNFRMDFTASQRDLIKRTMCKDGSNDDLEMFLGVCQKTGLDPLSRQIYAVFRFDKRKNKNVMSIQTSIDGFRVVAQRSKEYCGQVGPFWCGDDGVWVDVWLKSEPPKAAKVGVLRSNFRDPLFAVAVFDSFAQRFQDGRLNQMWGNMPDLMIAKCAESQALRRAFPQELSGLYTSDEMGQADNKREIQPQESAPIETPVQVVEDAPQVRQLPEITEEERTSRRKWRAAVNKAGQAAKSLEDIAKSVTHFSDKLGDMFDYPTYHNETETFRSLLAVHAERITEEMDRQSPEGVKRWVDLMHKSKDSEFPSFVRVFQANGYLQTVEVEQELRDKANALGFGSHLDAVAEQV